MHDDISLAIAAAWSHIRPRLERDSDELQKRLARRHSRLIESPPRAWCIALRASDTRLDACRTSHQSSVTNHQLLITSRDLRRLAQPVHLSKPGEPIADVAAKLGTTRSGLLNARVAGILRAHYVHTSPGRPTPLLYTDQPLDPSSRHFACVDPVFAATAPHLPGRIPPGIRVTLTRTPRFVDRTRAYRDKADLHPEHPDVDTSALSLSRGRSRKLPPPPPDPVWYKWKGDEFIGYDWRSGNELIKTNYERRQRQLEQSRAAQKARRSRRRGLSRSHGSLQFRGYQFLCPACKRKVNILYYPLPRLHLLPVLSEVEGPLHRAILRADSATRSLGPVPTFACDKCHHIKRISRCDKNGWNEIISYLTGGLLYGREVTPPAWFTPTRKIKYTPRPTRAPSQRRPQVERLLLAGRSFKQIAAALGLTYGTILWFAQQVYKQHNVRTLPELLRKHGHDIPEPMTNQVRRRLLAGQSIAQIEADLGCGKTMIYNQRQQLRKEGVKLPTAQISAVVA